MPPVRNFFRLLFPAELVVSGDVLFDGFESLSSVVITCSIVTPLRKILINFVSVAFKYWHDFILALRRLRLRFTYSPLLLQIFLHRIDSANFHISPLVLSYEMLAYLCDNQF